MKVDAWEKKCVALFIEKREKYETDHEIRIQNIIRKQNYYTIVFPVTTVHVNEIEKIHDVLV